MWIWIGLGLILLAAFIGIMIWRHKRQGIKLRENYYEEGNRKEFVPIGPPEVEGQLPVLSQREPAVVEREPSVERNDEPERRGVFQIAVDININDNRNDTVGDKPKSKRTKK